MITLGLILAVLLMLGYSFLRGYRRGLSKSIFHAGTIIVRFVLAIVLTRVFFRTGASMAQQALLGAAPELADIFADPSISGFAIALVQMLTSAIVFLLLYLVLGFVLKPLELIIRRIAFGKNKRSLIGGAVGAFCGLLVITALYTPINGMVHVASRVLYATEQTVYGEELPADTNPVVATVASIDRSPVLRVQRALGGKGLFSLITSVKYNDTKTNLNKEADAIVGMTNAAMTVASKPATEWGQTEVTALHNLAASFGESKLLPQAASSILASANTKWSAGQTFCGIEKPTTNATIQPTIDLLLRSFGNSTPEEISHTLVSLADLVGVLNNHGAFAILSGDGEGGSNQIIDLLSDKELLPDLMNCMYNDKNLRVCVPELINIGLRAMGESMGIAADKEELYSDFMTEIADAFNLGIEVGATRAERLSALTDDLMDISDSYGLHMTEAGALYVATYLIEDLGDAAITPADVENWFISYAAAADTEQDVAATPTAGSSLPVLSLKNDKGFSGNATYAGAIPTQYMEFTYADGAITAKIGIFTRTDGSLLVQEQGADGAATTPWSTVAQFVASMDNAFTLTVNKGEIKNYHSSLPSFTVTVAPRSVTSTEAALVNASFALSLKAEEAFEQLATVLPSFVSNEEEKLPLPQCVQSVLSDVLDDVDTPMEPAKFLEAIQLCAEKTGFSTGNATTLSDPESMKTERVTVADMQLDSEQVAANLPNLNKDAITESLSTVLDAASSLLAGGEEGINVEDALNALTGIQSAIEELDRPVADAPATENKPSTNQNIVNGLLNSDTVKDALPVDKEVIGDLAGNLGGTTEDTANVLNDLTGLVTAIMAVIDESGDTEAAKEQLSDVLGNLSPAGAQMISKTLTVDLFTKLGMPEEVADDLAPLFSGFFSDLANAKENKLNKKEFEQEAHALQVLLEMALDMEQNDTESDHYFGEDGRLGITAQELVENVLSSKVLTHNLLKVTIVNADGMRFVVKEDCFTLLDYDSMPEEDRAALIAALNAYWEEHSPALHDARNAGDLWLYGNHFTKTDLARRLTVAYILFGLVEDPHTADYSTLFDGENNLSEDIDVKQITVKGKTGSGRVIFTLKSSGTVSVSVEHGGIADILVNENDFDPNNLTDALALRLTITEGDIAWTAQKSDSELRIYTKDLLGK